MTEGEKRWKREREGEQKRGCVEEDIENEVARRWRRMEGVNGKKRKS
jgi:hypothetical protein